jgi:DNA primase
MPDLEKGAYPMTLQSSPQVTNESSSPLIRKSDGLYYTAAKLSFRITGLKPHNLDRLRVTLKASMDDKPDVFHIDGLDLYNSRSREAFCESCQKYLKVKPETTAAELSELIKALERERIVMRERGTQEAILPMTPEEKKEALEALRSTSLLKTIVNDFDAIGFIGEKHNKLLGYIAAVSRLLPDPLAVLILSRSGAGKTSLQDAVCKFIPPESVIQYTRLTGKSLFYKEENDLKHKVLAIEEEEGMQEAMYSIKTLITSQKLSVAATRTDAKTGKLSVDEYTVYGPVVVMVSTTNPNGLTDEEKRRFLILTIDESRERTRSILQMQRQKNRHLWYKTSMDEAGITRLHHNMQRLLKPLTVTFPDDVVIEYPDGRLQMRGEQGKFISLVKAITLLHQHQRKTGRDERLGGTSFEYVQATQRDVELARELGRAVFPRNVDDVSPTGRTLLGHIDDFVHEKHRTLRGKEPENNEDLSSIPFTRKELRERNGWSEKQIRTNIEPLVELGYLASVGHSRQGSAYRYLLLDNGKDDPQLEL